MVEVIKMSKNPFWRKCAVFIMLLPVLACSSSGTYDVYHSEDMDFASIQSVAVMPLANLTRDNMAAERVRDVFMTMLLAAGSIYVIPPGEVARGISMAGISNPTNPSDGDIKKLATALKADAVITGVLREYGDVRQMTIAGNIISFSLQMKEAQAGKVVWSASATRGGIGMKERLIGGGGEPMNNITEKAVNEIINKLFK